MFLIAQRVFAAFNSPKELNYSSAAVLKKQHVKRKVTAQPLTFSRARGLRLQYRANFAFRETASRKAQQGAKGERRTNYGTLTEKHNKTKGEGERAARDSHLPGPIRGHWVKKNTEKAAPKKKQQRSAHLN